MGRKPRCTKGINNNRSAQAAAVAATKCSTGYSIGNSCRKQYWPLSARHSNARSAQATTLAAALAAACRPQHWPQHLPQRAGHKTDRSNGDSAQPTLLPQHWSQRAGYTTGRYTSCITFGARTF